MKLNSLVYYHPGRWPEQMRTKWEKEFFRWRKEAELYLTEKANKSHLSPILLQRLLCLLIATWPKRKHVNLMKDGWGVLVLGVRDVRLWVGFHHAVYSPGKMSIGFSFLPPSLSTLNELEPMVSRLLWSHSSLLFMCIKSPLLSFPWNNSWVSYMHFLREKSTAESASQFSLKGVEYTLRSTDPENPEEFFIWWGKSWMVWEWKKEVCDCEKAGWYSWAGC